ncbi:MAG TPA: septal ring lytic transglycosylase RlpA family protein [Solirubrobacteraceae bacterium]|nr:septal ring lytic transglycosylase RlpA family protein [Solirubrobacteraceae bacterium]
MEAAVPPTRLMDAFAPPGIVALDSETKAPLLGQLAEQGSTETELHVRRDSLNVLYGHPAVVTGALRPGLAGRVVALQVALRRGWRSVAWTRTGPLGGFRLRYTPHTIGSERVRLRFAGDVHDMPAARPLGRLNVYRRVVASWYGGGGSLACGGWLTSSTLGVANKTLPCGTLVTLRYGGRSVRVPVVDRGPYVAGREFDLTEATKRALRFGSTGEVWSTG